MSTVEIRGPEAAVRPGDAAGAAARRRLSLRSRVILALVGLGVTIWILLASAFVLNARIAVEREIGSSFDVAARYLAVQKRHAEEATVAAGHFDRLAAGGGMRHVRVTVIDPDGRVLPLPEAEVADAAEEDGAGEDDAPPDWFVDLIAGPPLRHDLPVVLRSGETWLLVLESHSFDEIEEVWEDFRVILPITMAYTAVLIAASVLVLNFIFARFRVLSDGLLHLREGKHAVRLADTGIPEFQPFVDRFNHVAAALAAREEENRQLTRRLLWIQDAERHQIAHELHDELGPYLFGLRATLDSLARRSGRRGAEVLPDDALASLSDSVQAIQTRTRRIISNLRPMSLGEVPVTDLVEDGIADVQRFTPQAEIRFAPARCCARSFGEAIDLTIYRFVQESVLNALRHGAARHITVSMRQDDEAGATPALRVEVADDGKGPADDAVKPGYGLVGVAERAAALGGLWSPPRRHGSVTVTAIRLPLVEGAATFHPAPEAQR